RRPLSGVRRTVPPQIDAAVRRAIEKLPADRFATAHDFADALTRPQGALSWGAEAPATGKTGGSARPQARTNRALIAVNIAAVLVAAGLTAAMLLRRTPVEREIRFSLV